jgi:hypothetical protein
MTQVILLRQIAFLKSENAILCSRLSKHVQTTPAGRVLLVRLGRPLGNAIREMFSIVHYKMFLRWVREEKTGESKNGKPTHTAIGSPNAFNTAMHFILVMPFMPIMEVAAPAARWE